MDCRALPLRTIVHEVAIARGSRKRWLVTIDHDCVSDRHQSRNCRQFILSVLQKSLSMKVMGCTFLIIFSEGQHSCSRPQFQVSSEVEDSLRGRRKGPAWIDVDEVISENTGG